MPNENEVADSAIELVSQGRLSIAESMKLSGMSRAHLYTLMASGELSFCKDGKRRLIPKLALLRLMAATVVTAK